MADNRGFTVLDNRKAKKGPKGASGPASASPWRAKEKIILEKYLTMPKKLKGGPFGIFQHLFCRKTPKKIEEGTLLKKSLAMPKKTERGLARYGMLRGKTGKTFLVQFARPNRAIVFCRTFKNYFGQIVWIEKKKRKTTIIVAFHFMKRRLKIRIQIFASSKKFY